MKTYTSLAFLFAITLATPTEAQPVEFSRSPSFSDQAIPLETPGQPIGGLDAVSLGNETVVGLGLQLYTSGSLTDIYRMKQRVTNFELYNASGTLVAGPVNPTPMTMAGVSLWFGDALSLNSGTNSFVVKARVGYGNNLWSPIELRLVTVLIKSASGTSRIDVRNAPFLGKITLKYPELNIGWDGPVQTRTNVGGSTTTFAKYLFQVPQETGVDTTIDYFALPLHVDAGNPVDMMTVQFVETSANTPLNTGANVRGPIRDDQGNWWIDCAPDRQMKIGRGKFLEVSMIVKTHSGSTGSFRFELPKEGFVFATGTETGTLVAIKHMSPGSTTTAKIVQKGAVSVSLDSNNPPAQDLEPGVSENVTVAVLRFLASYEPGGFQKLGLRFTGSNVNAIKDNRYTVWASGIMVGEGYFLPQSNGGSFSTLVEPVVVPTRDSTVSLAIKVKVSSLESGLVADGDTIGVEWDYENPTNTVFVGSNSGMTINPEPDSRARGNIMTVRTKQPTAESYWDINVTDELLEPGEIKFMSNQDGDWFCIFPLNRTLAQNETVVWTTPTSFWSLPRRDIYFGESGLNAGFIIPNQTYPADKSGVEWFKGNASLSVLRREN